MKVNIIGAGLSGLLAGFVFQEGEIFERNSKPTQSHKALLRFRSKAVSDLTGIDFREVTVRKGIWHRNEFQSPNIKLGNLYSLKCLGAMMGDRSIWNLDPVQRYIAPDDFYDRLILALQPRIKFDSPFDVSLRTHNDVPTISTIPMPVVLDGLCPLDVEFNHAAISVARIFLPDCDVFQTIYFPSMDHSLYRGSITGNTLILEFIDEPEGEWASEVRDAFGIGAALPTLNKISSGVSKQTYGKIAPIDNEWRKAAIGMLTDEYNVYSVGRFATWRNILLDDVVKDCAVVKRLINSSKYARRLSR